VSSPRAAHHYLDQPDTRSLTGRIDEDVEGIGPPDGPTADAVATGHRLLTPADDQW
jgi:hypothetical protein